MGCKHTGFGAFVNHIRNSQTGTLPAMEISRQDPKQVLWANVHKLMEHRWGQENINRLSRDAKIGPGSASRIKEQKTSVGIDVVAKIAKAFDVEPWHLLLPNLDPSNLPVATLTDAEAALYARIRRHYEGLMSGQ
jgi:hypothetical protein